MHFYSLAAYEYVRAKFNDTLLAQRTMRKWYKSVNSELKFTSKAFSLLSNVVQGWDEPLYAAEMVNDMSTKEHLQLVDNEVDGYVELGTELFHDSLQEATNACD